MSQEMLLFRDNTVFSAFSNRERLEDMESRKLSELENTDDTATNSRFSFINIPQNHTQVYLGQHAVDRVTKQQQILPRKLDRNDNGGRRWMRRKENGY